MRVSESISLPLSAARGSKCWILRILLIFNIHAGVMYAESSIESARVYTGLGGTNMIRVLVAVKWVVLWLVGLLLSAFILDWRL